MGKCCIARFCWLVSRSFSSVNLLFPLFIPMRGKKKPASNCLSSLIHSAKIIASHACLKLKILVSISLISIFNWNRITCVATENRASICSFSLRSVIIFAWLANYVTCNLHAADRRIFPSARAGLANWTAHTDCLGTQRNCRFCSGKGLQFCLLNKPPGWSWCYWSQDPSLSSKVENRGVTFMFTGGHLSLTVAFKGPNVILGLCKCNYSLTVKQELGAAAW